jgi:hypothetical protein
MKSFLNTNKSTLVKIAVNLAITFMIPNVGLADAKDLINNAAQTTALENVTGKQVTDSATLAKMLAIQGAKDKMESQCNKLQDQAQKAWDAIDKSCKDSGSADCSKMVRQCETQASTVDYSVVNDLYSQITSATGGTTAQSAQATQKTACPQLSGKTAADQQKDLEKELETAQKAEADIEKDITDAKDKFSTASQDIQKSLQDAQDDFNKTSKDLKQDARQQTADAQKSQQQAAQSMRDKVSQRLKLQGDLAKVQQDKALKLISMTDASGVRACQNAVNTQKKSDGYIGNSSMRDQQARKNNYIAIYNDCMSSFDKQREALIQTSRQQTDEINNQIDNLNSDIDEIQNTLNLSQSQLTEIQTQNSTDSSNAQTKLTQTNTNLQNKLTSEYQKEIDTVKTLTQRQTDQTAKIRNINNKLAALQKMGSPDAATDASVSYSAASSSINKSMMQLSQVNDAVTSLNSSQLAKDSNMPCIVTGTGSSSSVKTKFQQTYSNGNSNDSSDGSN